MIGCVLALLAASVAAAQTAIDSIEPPNWWIGHSMNPVRVLIKGRNLKAGPVITGTADIQADPAEVSADRRYAFADLRVAPGVKPGSYILRLGGASTTFILDRRPSPDGQFQGFGPDDVIYLIVVDRFANGDGAPTNTSDPRGYQGGDLDGIRQRLPYLKELGVTALWLTPLYDNGGTGYHGYHAINFYKVEENFGDMARLQRLVTVAHRHGLKVILDLVMNHAGSEHPWVAQPPTSSWLNGTAETHRPFAVEMWSLVDPRSTGALVRQTLEGWFVNRLPDLNQNDPEVARYLIQNTLWWIGMTGADGVRADTVPYVPAAFWKQWLRAIRREHPKLRVLGETYSGDALIVSHFQELGFDSVFDFPLFFAARNVFAKGSGRMSEIPRVLAHDRLYPRPERLVTFIGLHDFPRFRTEAGGSTEAVKQALTFLATTRGIPLIYYGDEIGMEGGGDPHNRRFFPQAVAADNEMLAFTRRLLKLRRESTALRRGSLTHLAIADDAYVYARQSSEETVLVALGAAREASIRELRLGPGEANDELGSANKARVTGEAARFDGPGVYRFAAANRAQGGEAVATTVQAYKLRVQPMRGPRR